MISIAGTQVISGFRFGFSQPCAIFRTETSPELSVSPEFESIFLKAVSDCLPPRDDLTAPLKDTDPQLRLMALCARVCSAMQDSVGVPVVGTEKMRPLPAAGAGKSWMVVVPTFATRAARLAFKEVILVVNSLAEDQTKDRLTKAEQERFDATLDEIAKSAPAGSNTHGFLRQALKSGIPLTPLPAGIWQYGWGRQARVFLSSLSDATSSIGTFLAREKAHTNAILKLGELPVAQQVAVADIDAAIQAADKVGYPVVVKTADLDQGKGVEAGLQNETELRRAFARVASHERPVLLEKHVHGYDVRVNVMHGTYQTSVMRQHAHVAGDGVRTIADLIAEKNRDPRRSSRRFSQMRPITINAEAEELLAAQSLTLDSVPEAGQTVRLRRVANVSSGGESQDITARLHPDNAALAEKAAKLLRLDIAGVDLLLPDPERSWRDTGGAVCEVNAQPQIGQTFPTVFRDIFDRYVTGQGRIPTAFVLTDHAETVAEQISQQLSGQDSANIRVIGDTVSAPRSMPARITAALIDPDTTGCIVVSDARDVLTDGMPIDRFDTLWVSQWSGDANALTRRIGMVSQHVTNRTVVLADQFGAPDRLAEAAAHIRIDPSNLATACEAFCTAVAAQPQS